MDNERTFALFQAYLGGCSAVTTSEQTAPTAAPENRVDVEMEAGQDTDSLHGEETEPAEGFDIFGLPRQERDRIQFKGGASGSAVPACAAGFYELTASDRELSDMSARRLRRAYPLLDTGDMDAIPEVDTWLSGKKKNAKHTFSGAAYDSQCNKQRHRWVLAQHIGVSTLHRAVQLRDYISSDGADKATIDNQWDRLLSAIEDSLATAMDGRAALERQRRAVWAEAVGLSPEIRDALGSVKSDDPRVLFGTAVQRLAQDERDNRRDDLIAKTLARGSDNRRPPPKDGTFRKPAFQPNRSGFGNARSAAPRGRPAMRPKQEWGRRTDNGAPKPAPLD